MIMILPYGAGGEPGRGETPMMRRNTPQPYIDTGIIPKYAGCVNGVQWFKDRWQWIDGSAEPVPSMIIFFNWDSPDGESGPQDGLSDHTGIVEKVENGVIYTVEGNSGDSCRINQYPVGYYEIFGYGVLQY